MDETSPAQDRTKFKSASSKIDPYRFFEVAYAGPDGDKRKDRIKCHFCDYELIRRSDRCIVHSIRCKNIPIDKKLKYGFINDDDITEGSDGAQKVKESSMVSEEQARQSTRRRKRFGKMRADGELTEGGSGDDGMLTDSQIKSESGGRKSKRRRKTPSKFANSGTFDSSDEEFGASLRGNSRYSNKHEALSFFSNFIDNISGGVRQKKKFADYSEDEWKQEERELNIRERRARIRHLESQSKMFEAKEYYLSRKPHLKEKQIQLLEPISQAAQMFLSQQAVNQLSAAVNASDTSELKGYTIEPVEVLSAVDITTDA